MPLLKGKKNIGRNIETEEKAGKPKAQSLAIALSMARRSKKKMAKGGEITADSEKRPMPDDTHDDKMQTSRKGDMHEASGWLDNKKEAGKSGPMKANEADEDFVSEDMTDTMKAKTAEEMNMEKESPTDPKHIKSREYEGTKRAKLAKGGMVNFDTEARPSIDNEDRDESMSMERESSSDPKHINADHDKDNADAHLAMGGDVEEHYDSIADAILAKKKRAKMDNDDMADVSLNATEEPNNEDDLSFDALRKENYAESEGLAQLDSPKDSNLHGDTLEDEDENGRSIVDSIRRKKKAKL